MPPPLAKRADAQRNRAKIVATAEAMFARDGIAVSVDDIAQQAKVGIGTLYRHFPTKDALVAAIVVERVTRIAEHTEALLGERDAGAALSALIERMVEEGVQKRDFVDSLGSSELLMTPVLDQIRARLRKALGKLLAKAQKQGAVRDDVEPADIIALVKGLFSADPKSRARLMEIFLAGLARLP